MINHFQIILRLHMQIFHRQNKLSHFFNDDVILHFLNWHSSECIEPVHAFLPIARDDVFSESHARWSTFKPSVAVWALPKDIVEVKLRISVAWGIGIVVSCLPIRIVPVVKRFVAWNATSVFVKVSDTHRIAHHFPKLFLNRSASMRAERYATYPSWYFHHNIILVI